MSGTVETLQNYGAFVKLENGLSGLVHVSQISQKRVKNPAAVLNVGDEVQVKVIGIKDGKISLSLSLIHIFINTIGPAYKEKVGHEAEFYTVDIGSGAQKLETL